jgi:hypothetical protein
VLGPKTTGAVRRPFVHLCPEEGYGSEYGASLCKLMVWLLVPPVAFLRLGARGPYLTLEAQGPRIQLYVWAPCVLPWEGSRGGRQMLALGGWPASSGPACRLRCGSRQRGVGQNLTGTKSTIPKLV